MRTVQLGERTISDGSRPYLIAEIGVNHEGSMQTAKELVHQAKEGGADAAKFQSYKAETLASRNSPAYWNLDEEPTENQYALFKKYDDFGPEEYRELADFCSEVGIDFLSTPFDEAAVEFLDPLVPFFKVASADITNLPFLEEIGSREKPVVLSTGAATLAEIDEAVRTLKDVGCPDVVLLHCILNYPTDITNAHLRMIEGLRRTYPQSVVGYSDHTCPDENMTPLVTAFLLGARVIEKHFTHDKTLPGNDHYHSMDQHDLATFTSRLDRITALMGSEPHKRPIPTEADSRKHARRSIVLRENVEAGTKLTENLLTCKRPGTGISPKHWEGIIGRTAGSDMAADHILTWEDVAQEA